MKIGSYINGNTTVSIFDDGTKIRMTKDAFFNPEKPESMDMKITNMCDMGCPQCHEKSVPDGKHGDITDIPFLDTLNPYTEIAIGGGNPLAHPDLIPFLIMLSAKNFIPNMTVNQFHFQTNFEKIDRLVDAQLIYGLGISLNNAFEEGFIERVQKFPNAVIHVIAGVTPLADIKRLYDCGLKVLILGYKKFGRGEAYYAAHELVDQNITALRDELPEMIKHFNVVSFDNLAVEQMNVRSLLSEDEWNEFYMGNDGEFTMYVDMVNRQFAKSSVSTTRYPISDDIAEMFQKVREERG